MLMHLDKRVIATLLALVFLMSGCATSEYNNEITVQKKALIPLEKRNVYINNIPLDNLFLKLNLQAAIFNAPKIESQSYLALNNKENADTHIDIKILNNEHKPYDFNRKAYSSDRAKSCRIHNYVLKILLTAYDKNTKEIFVSKVFTSYQQKESCQDRAIFEEQLEESATEEIIKKILAHIIPEPFHIPVAPLKSIEIYDKDEVKMFNKGISYIEDKEFHKAKDIFIVLSFRKDDYTVNYNLGLCYEMLGKYGTALKHYKKASKKFMQSNGFDLAKFSYNRVLGLMH